MFDAVRASKRLAQAAAVKGPGFRSDAPPIGDAAQVRAVLASRLSGRHLETVTKSLIAYRVTPDVFLDANDEGRAGAGFTARQLALLQHVGLPAAASWRALCAFPRHPTLLGTVGIAHLIDCAARGDSPKTIQLHLAGVCASLKPVGPGVLAALGGEVAAAVPDFALPGPPAEPTEASVRQWFADIKRELRRAIDWLGENQAPVATSTRDDLIVAHVGLEDLEKSFNAGSLSPAGALTIAQRP